MSELTTYKIIDDIGVIQLDAPPVNALGAAVRRDLCDIFDEIAKSQAVKGVVITANGRLFSAGADINELGQKSDAPPLGTICDMIEACKVPVVAALHGAALGGGAEIALAAHYRIASDDGSIGLPEVKLGLLPGAGGTQRLPRLVGAKNALKLILGGKPVDAATALEMGLIDKIIEDRLPIRPINYARQAAEHGPRPTRSMRRHLTDGAAFLQQINERRLAISTNTIFAAHRAIDCVEGALLLPFDAGLKLEADAFEECLQNPQSQALRHIFWAERRIAPGLLAKTQTGYDVADPEGGFVVRQLREAWHNCVRSLLQQGFTEAEIDQAHVGYGFTQGPFGGRDAGEGKNQTDIQQRVIAALMAEGARMVQGGAVAQPSDIDALAVHALDFPRWQGGPMKAAQLAWLPTLIAKMNTWKADDPVWNAPNLALRAARVARGFDEVTR